MKLECLPFRKVYAWAMFFVAISLLAGRVVAGEPGAQPLKFQKPNVGRTATPERTGSVQFRDVRAGGEAPAAPADAKPVLPTAPRVEQQPSGVVATVAHKPAAVAAPAAEVRPAHFAKPQPLSAAPRPAAEVRTAQEDRAVRRADRRQSPVPQDALILQEPLEFAGARHATHCQCDRCISGYEPACGLYEPACGLCEAACGCAEPVCGICEPGCAFEEPMCGIAEPTCGVVGCGSCVGNPGPDYWCFPVCLPRLKQITFWGGVHGFKGPRDYFNNGTGESNFGFQEGVNLGGRTPLIGLVFPQISYQLGYQAVQSRLSGTLNGPNDRNQNFVTAGFFRRVGSGLQFGCVWDMMRDDLVYSEDFHQLRYEASLKSRGGAEIGFRGSSNTNSKVVDGIDFQAVNQHTAFFRWTFRDGGTARIWGGGTDNSEGIIGADFAAPLSDRWSVQSGFNYLIPDAAEGPDGAREESWNVGLNLVWHWGCIAKKNRWNPHAPLFDVADNGWMFIDRRN